MADTITLNAGSGGATLNTDDIGGTHTQIIKLGFGALDALTLVSTSNGLPVQQQGTWNIDDISAGTQTNDVKVTLDSEVVTVDLGANNDVTIDNSSIVLAEDAVHSTGDAGVMSLAVRNDTLAALAGTDGDYAPLQVNASGAVYIQEGAALDVSAATVNIQEATALDVSAAVVSVDDNAGSLTIDNSDLTTIAGAVSGSEMQVDVVAALPAGTNAIGKLAANSGVDIGDVDVTSITPGSSASNLGKAEDAAHSTGDVGVMSLAVRDTTPAVLSGADGDYEPLHVSDDGGLWVTIAPSHQGGNSFFSSIDLDETEEEVSSSACTVTYMYFWNATAAPLWAQIFNNTAASIAPGTDAPDINFPIPANADSDVAGVIVPVPQGGIQFGTALSVAVTTGSGTDSGAPGANEAGAIIMFKA